MRPRRKRFALLAALIFLLALSVRLFGWNYDQGHLFHPDERRIAEAVTTITFSPLQLNPRFFAYGSFPFYVTRAAQAVLTPISDRYAGYDGAIRAGRQLSALWGAATVLLLVLLGRLLYGRRVGLLAGLLLALAVLHIQNSHFGVNDVPLAFLSLSCATALVLAARSGQTRWFVIAGVALGLSVATKFSALPLGAAVVASLALRLKEDGWKHTAGNAALLGLAGALSFVAGSPYAILDWKAYSHDILEQSRMVRNAGNVPYTNQYVGTQKVLYDLREIFFWGLGPLLALAGLFGTGVRIRRALSPRRRLDLVLLAWAVPFFLITASFDVKFPRYLLPIHPLLCLWAAAALVAWSQRARAGRVLSRGVLLATLAHALAFLTIYTRPFTVRAASEWVYENVPAGSKLLSQDWDEGFPFSLGDRGTPDRYRIVNFSFYEPDSNEKMMRLAAELSSADYVVFQTKRLYGATTQNARVFPYTSRAFALLFDAELGYRMVKEFTSRPRLFGIELPSELADESFSVYDHPKVVIFENTRRLAVEEIARILLDGSVKPPLTRTQILLARPPDEDGLRAQGPVENSIAASLLVYLLLQALGLSAFSLLGRLVPRFKGLYALSKVTGVLAFAYLTWIGTSMGLFEFRPGALVLTALLLIGAGWAAWKTRVGLLDLKEVAATELFASGSFFLFLFFRMLNPEIFWGEKPMDFSFLNTLYRAATLPPPETWCAGTNLSYSYFGHYLVAAIGKATGVAPGVMFNIGMGLAGWLLSSALFFAGSVAGRALSSGAAATILGLFTGTLAGPFELIARKGVMDFHYFWATSRVIPPNGINEYPFWSLLFADLHAHVFAMPWAVTLTGLVLLWLWRLDSPGGFHPLERVTFLSLASVLFGAVGVSSAWSLPTYALLPAFIFLFDLAGHIRGGTSREPLLTFLASRAALVFIPPAAGFVLFLPFLWRFSAPPRQFGRELGPWAPPHTVLLVFGFFLAIVVPFLFIWWRRERSRGRALLVAALLALSMANPGALLRGHLSEAVSALPLFAGLFLLGLSFTTDPDPFRRRVAILPAYAFAMIAGCEIIFVWDRMNTIFKFHLDAWLILSIGAAPLAAALARGWMPGEGSSVSFQRANRSWRAVAAIVAIPALFTTLTGPLSSAWPRKIAGPDGTLHGTAYLKAKDPGEAELFSWLNTEVRGLPTLVEAFGPSYQEFARGAMFTGLPIVIGWDYHVSQRGRPWRDIDRRKADVLALYKSENREEVQRILRHYRIRYVLSANKEIEVYGSGHRQRFADWPAIFPSVRKWGDAFLYETDLAGGSPRQAAETPETESAILKRARQALALPVSAPLQEPRGLARDPAGNTYITDFGNNRVVKLGPGLQPAASWGTKGKEPGNFDQPSAVTVLSDGNIAVLDTWNSRIQVLTPAGEFLRQIRGDFFGPRGMVFLPGGSCLLVDTGNHRIVVIDKDGAIEKTWGEKGSGPRQFIDPVGIAVGPGGDIFVCDTGNGRLQVLSKTGEFLRQVPLPGVRREALSEPKVVVSPKGKVYVVLPLSRQIARLGANDSLEIVARAPALSGIPIEITFDETGERFLVLFIDGRLLWLDAETGQP